MGLKDTAKELIDANVYANGTEKITGQGLNATLKGMVDILPTLEEVTSGLTKKTTDVQHGDKIIKKFLGYINPDGTVNALDQGEIDKFISNEGYTDDPDEALDFRPFYSLENTIDDILGTTPKTYGTDNAVVNGSTQLSGIMINQGFVATHDGVITKLRMNRPTASPTGFLIVEKVSATEFKSLSYYEINALAGNNEYDVNIPIKKNQALALIFNNTGFYMKDGGGVDFINGYELTVMGTTEAVTVSYPVSAAYSYTVEREELKEEDVIKIAADTKIRRRLERVYYLEDFGAVALDPLNPDAGTDCTDAFQNCLNKIFADNDVYHAVIKLRGMYRLAGPFKKVPDTSLSYAQIVLPRIPYSPTMVIKTLSIISDHFPIYEEQGIIEMPVSYGAAGFYCDQLNAWGAAPYVNYCISLNWGAASGVFEMFNNVNIWMDKIAIIVRAHDANGNPFSNVISAIDASSNSNFQFGHLLLRTSVATKNSLEPSSNSYGLYLPQFLNHANISGHVLNSYGFGTGFVATEHLQLGKYTGCGNRIALYCEHQYPITIGTVTVEMNKIPIMMRNQSALNMTVYQTERKLGNHWYAQAGNDIVQESGTSTVNITNTIVHMEGGGAVQMTWDSGVKMKYMCDEFGRSWIPENVWDALPANPVNGLEGYFNNVKVVYLNGWKNASTMASI